MEKANVVTFTQVLPGPPPRRASRSCEGTLPHRAVQYCHAVTEAAGYGWHLMPPMDFSVIYYGADDAVWTWEGKDEWYPLTRAQYPGFAETFAAAAPSRAKPLSPPFLAMGEDPGVLQIWTGAFAHTIKDWSLLIRGPVNMAHSVGFTHLEGIIETDRWFGPLFGNIRLHETDGRPVSFKARHPLFQVTPVPRQAYDSQLLDAAAVRLGLGSLGLSDWNSYVETMIHEPHRLGRYAVDARKRRAEERK